MGINPIQFFQMLRGGGNPQQMIQQMMNNPQIKNNPMAKNAMEMFQKGDEKGVEQMARNICKEKGINPDELLAQVKQQFGMK